jgi:hypothetical protein
MYAENAFIVPRRTAASSSLCTGDSHHILSLYEFLRLTHLTESLDAIDTVTPPIMVLVLRKLPSCKKYDVQRSLHGWKNLSVLTHC